MDEDAEAALEESLFNKDSESFISDQDILDFKEQEEQWRQENEALFESFLNGEEES
jgi:N-acetylneuraminic acid mutarotase